MKYRVTRDLSSRGYGIVNGEDRGHVVRYFVMSWEVIVDKSKVKCVKLDVHLYIDVSS